MPFYDIVADLGDQDDEDRQFRRTWCNPANRRRLILELQFSEAEYRRQIGFSKPHFERQENNVEL